jgi:hypothetical protein
MALLGHRKGNVAQRRDYFSFLQWLWVIGINIKRDRGHLKHARLQGMFSNRFL